MKERRRLRASFCGVPQVCVVCERVCSMTANVQNISSLASTGLSSLLNDNMSVKAVSGDRFAPADIWIVDEETYADLKRNDRRVLELDYMRSNAPYYDPQRARALRGDKLVVARDGSKGFVLQVDGRISAATAEGFFISHRLEAGQKLAGRYESAESVNALAVARVTAEGFELGDHVPVLAMYQSRPQPFSEEAVTPAIAQYAIKRREGAGLDETAQLGL